MDSLKGKLLISSPAIEDPHFRRTVVLMAEHNDEGAMGLVLNRTMPATVAEAVPDLAWLADEDSPIHEGGPVSAQSVVVLAEFDRPDESALLVDDDLGFVPAHVEDPDALGPAVRRARVFAGHAGWGPGQLEAEMEEESWIVVPLDHEDVFCEDPEELWATVVKRQGNQLALLATMPPDPSLN